MRTSVLPALVVSAGLVLSSPAGAQQVYKWKDARGVTHYSQDPPPSGKYTTQTVSAPAPAKPADDADAGAATGAAPGNAAGATASAKPDTRCDSARRNLQALGGGNPVLVDSDGDGKPDKPLNDTERGNQQELARATLKAYNCDVGEVTGAGG